MPMDKAERKEITQIKESIARLDDDLDALTTTMELITKEVVDGDEKRKQTQQTLEKKLSAMRSELDSRPLDAHSILNNWNRAIQVSSEKSKQEMENLHLLTTGHKATTETSKLMQKQIATMATLLDQQKVNGLRLDNQTRNALIRGLSKNVSEQITPPLTQNLDKTIGNLSSSVDNSVGKNLARMKTSVSSTMSDARKDMRKVKDEIRADVVSQVVDELEEHRSRTVDVVLTVLGVIAVLLAVVVGGHLLLDIVSTLSQFITDIYLNVVPLRWMSIPWAIGSAIATLAYAALFWGIWRGLTKWDVWDQFKGWWSK